jgi:hypothetical protein
MEVHMRAAQGRMLERLRAVQAFIDANKDRLAGLAESGCRRQLDKVIAEALEHALNQASNAHSSRGATAEVRAIRAALVRDYLKPIAGIAAAQLPSMPALKVLLIRPKHYLSGGQLAAYGQRIANEARPFSDVFVSAGMHPAFADRLDALAGQLLGALDVRRQMSGRSRAATSALAAVNVAAARVIGVLDALITSTLNDAPDLLAGWNQVKKIRK